MPRDGRQESKKLQAGGSRQKGWPVSWGQWLEVGAGRGAGPQVKPTGREERVGVCMHGGKL